MASKLRLLVCMIALAGALPARADVLLGYRIGLPPSGCMPDPNWIDNSRDPCFQGGAILLGPAITGPLMMTVGETMFIQITIQANATPLTSPTPSFPQSTWTNANRMYTFITDLRYPLGVAHNPFAPPIPPTDPDQNNANAIAAVPFSTGNPNTYPMYNMGGTAIAGATTGTGIGAQAGGIVNERVIAVFRLVAVAPGSGQLEIRDSNPSPASASFSLQSGQNLDEHIFHPSHNNWPLPVIVGVPEPSSIVLVGLPIAMAAWRHRRRKQQCAV